MSAEPLCNPVSSNSSAQLVKAKNSNVCLGKGVRKWAGRARLVLILFNVIFKIGNRLSFYYFIIHIAKIQSPDATF